MKGTWFSEGAEVGQGDAVPGRTQPAGKRLDVSRWGQFRAREVES